MAVLPRFWCGIDVGGTFTDLVLVDRLQLNVFTEKVLTTTADPSQAVVSGLRALHDRLSPEEQACALRLVHATTLVTNALVERRGARVGLLTTRGFRDILDLQRENRFDIFDLAIRFPKPLVPLELRWEADERIGSDGEEIEPLDPAGISHVSGEMREAGVESVAIAFLHSYDNPSHEEAARRALGEEWNCKFFSLSSDVAPHIREYERFTTTTVNAYVMPLVDRYLGELRQRVESVWPETMLSLMVSNGGICSPETARRFPVRLLESGPVAGALVAAYFGGLANHRDVLAFDMGGTTAKLCVVREGVPNMVAQFEADRTSRFKRGSGLPVIVPSVDLIEIGAGGGSIAWVDDLNLLQIGPRSAGASPGPACYGRGGDQATVTDADLLLGYLDPAYFLGGRMSLDPGAAKQALLRHVARPLNIDVEQAAWGIHELVNENMAAAAWLHMAEKGLDPRAYVLVATGGAGPVHACHVAVKLGISRVIYPPASGVASALGLLIAPPKADVSHTYLSPLDELDFSKLADHLARLEARALEILRESGVTQSTVGISRMADMLYRGQTHHIEVSLPAGILTAEDRARIAANFHDAYRARYGASLPEVAIEIVALRITALADVPQIPDKLFRHEDVADALRAEREVYVSESRGKRLVPVHLRNALPVGIVFEGPALVESADTTIMIEPGWRFSSDGFGILHLERTKGPSGTQEMVHG